MRLRDKLKRKKITQEYIDLRKEQEVNIDLIENVENLFEQFGIEIEPSLKQELDKLDIGRESLKDKIDKLRIR